MTNTIIIQGRLGADPKPGTTKDGTAYCKLDLATEDGYGQNKKTLWNTVFCRYKLVEIATKYCHKGDLINVTGRLTYTEKAGADGRKVKDYSIVATSIDFCTNRKSDDRGAALDWNSTIND